MVEAEKFLIITIFAITTACFVAGLVEFALSIWFDVKSDIDEIVRIGYNPGSLVGVFFSMPTAGAIQTIQPFIQILVVLVIYLKHKNLSICRINILIFIIFSFILSLCYVIIAIVALNQVPTFNKDLKSAMETALSRYQGYPNGYDERNTLTTHWDDLMQSKGCCGVNGHVDFIAGGTGFLATAWRDTALEYSLDNGTKFTGNDVKIPFSCCKLKDGLILNSEDFSSSNAHKKSANLLSETCPVDRSMSYTEGCKDPAVTTLTQFVIWTQTLLMVIGFIYDVLWVVGVYLLIKIKQDNGKIGEKENCCD